MVQITTVVAALFSMCAAGALAQPHRDVQVQVQEGVIVTGRIDFEVPGTPIIPDVRVFSGFFGEAPNGTDDPGYNASGGTTGSPAPFSPNTLIAFDIVDALRKWNGVDFSTLPPERIAIILGFNPVIVTPDIPDTVVPGFNFVSANSTGGFHQHINYFLDPPASNGVYLLTLRLRCNCASAPSAPFYIVFRQGNTQALIDAQAAAFSYVENVLSAPPVCPGDADFNGVVDFDDITAALANWGADYSPSTGRGDSDNSGFVDFDDITQVIANWGVTCP
jgi:hypothetical protein